MLALFREERIRTTLAKAKEVRGAAERLLTYAKQGGVGKRRLVASQISDRAVVTKIFEEIAPRFKDRSGGYTRIFQLGPRLGDAAPIAQLEIIGAPTVIKTEEGKGKPAPPRKPSPKLRAKKEETAKGEAKPEAEEEKSKPRGLKRFFGGGRKKPEGEGKERE
jgi:large subunit ribosomal protein L17